MKEIGWLDQEGQIFVKNAETIERIDIRVWGGWMNPGSRLNGIDGDGEVHGRHTLREG